MKNLRHPIWNRNRDLTACSAMPQPTALPPKSLDCTTTLKWILKNTVLQCILHSGGPGLSQVAGCFESSSEPAIYIKVE